MATDSGERADLAGRSGQGGRELSIPEDEEPYRCPHCGYPFRTERLELLHRGVAHGDELDEETRERYEAEFDDESHDLFTLHVKLAVGILLLYMTLSYVYMFVWL